MLPIQETRAAGGAEETEKEGDMAIRALTFGARLRDRARNRTLVIEQDEARRGRYVIVDDRPDGPKRRECGSAAQAVGEAAEIWRRRLN